MADRRDFIKQMSAGAIGVSIPGLFAADEKKENEKIWACLLHLSFNMWEEYVSPHRPFRGYDPNMRLSESLWDDSIRRMSEKGMNMIVIDLGNAVRYQSHPEIAVNNAWSIERLRSELQKMRNLGLEPIPKMNFSTGHDTWLGEYAKMVSTEKYYQVCADLISEVCDIFDKPRFFHLGMDEENAGHQSHYKYIVVRQGDAWWKDFFFLVEQVENKNSRAWIWPDYMLWNYTDEFLSKMPKTVVQSNWYYSEDFSGNKYVSAYNQLESAGYDQIPTGSYHAQNELSIINTTKFSASNIDDKKLLGILQTFWKPTIEEFRERIIKGIDLAGEAKQWYIKNRRY